MQNSRLVNMRHLKTILLVVIALAAAAALYLLPVREWVQQAQMWIEGLGPYGPLATILLYILLTVMAGPASLLTIFSGGAFGLWKGLLTIIIGANLGALCAFLLARTLLRDKVTKWAESNPKFASLDRAIEREGFKMVLLTRLSPVFPFVLLNYLLGLTRVRLGSYLLANLIGMLPGTFLYVYIGVAAREAINASSSGSAGIYKQMLTFIGLLATVGVVVMVTRMAKKAIAEAEQSAASDAENASPTSTQIAEVR